MNIKIKISVMDEHYNSGESTLELDIDSFSTERQESLAPLFPLLLGSARNDLDKQVRLKEKRESQSPKITVPESNVD